MLLLYAAVRRWFGPAAGLIAGAVLALTPAAALIFRFNNPDALLVLLMTAAGYGVQRAIERDRTRWLVLAGVLLGFAFLTKMMQAFLVLPGFGLAYLWAGPARLRRRIWQLLARLGGVIAGAGWWVAIAQLIAGGDRPYFGGSTDNNILELALGYNGLGRLDGSETGSIGGGGNGGGGGFGGATGIFRLFQSEFGGQVSWLIPAALISLAALLWVSRRAARTRRGSRVRPAVGRLAAGDRAGLQLHAGDHPPVLHGRARAGDRRARRRRRHGPVAGGAVQAGRASPPSACSSPAVGVRPARPDPGVAAVAALDRAARRAGARVAALFAVPLLATARRPPGTRRRRPGGGRGSPRGRGVRAAGLAAARARTRGRPRRAARLHA